MKEIELTKGQVALVDDWWYDRLVAMGPWCALESGNTFYAVRHEGKGTNHKLILMHRVIMDTQPGDEVDHLNFDGWNNQTDNMRNVTHKENLRHRQMQSNNTSGFIGVSWCEDRQKWEAYIHVNGKKHNLGRYNTAEEAARAYDRAALEYFGPNATLNFPL